MQPKRIKKPTLLYVSPFPPLRSGISLYSTYLVQGLEKVFDVTLLSIVFKNILPKSLQHLPFLRYKKGHDYSKYDYIIYNIGNNSICHSFIYEMMQTNPGFVIMHDVSLYYLTTGFYSQKNMVFNKIYEMQGIQGIIEAKDEIKESKSDDFSKVSKLSHKLPLNKEILSLSQGIIVHSGYAENEVRKIIPNMNILRIDLLDISEHYDSVDRSEIRKHWGLKQDDFVISAAGIISEPKMNEETCKAINIYNTRHPNEEVKYLMIGSGKYVDSYLSDTIKKTGYIKDKTFFECIIASDVIFNFRSHYNGETSGTLIQSLALGKICAVSDIGWFSELPDDCVLKLKNNSIDEIVNMIEKVRYAGLVNDKGIQYIKNNCNKDIISQNIYDFLTVSKNNC